MTTLFGSKQMSYIIRKKDSPYYVRKVEKIFDANYDMNSKVIFTDVKDLIELKLKTKKLAEEELKKIKSLFPKGMIDFEIEKLA